MDLLPSPEQMEIISSAASFLAATVPIARTRALMTEASKVDERAWSAAAELGWFGLGLPEAHGGVGCGLADEALLFREVGRSLASGPHLATVLGARVAAFGGRADLAEAIVGGARVGMIVPGRGADVDGDRDDDAISGELLLLDAVGADHVLLVQRHRSSLFALADLGAVTQIPCIDAAVALGRVQATRVAPVVSVTSAIDDVEGRGHVLAAAALTGIAEATRDIGAEHAKVRVQFGKPIGVNQAVKHPCAAMAVQSELAWAQTLMAALAIDEGRVDAELQALTAMLVAARAAEHNAAATVQVLGGMGFTFEHDANLYVKRAYVLGRLFGEERDALARLLELPAAV